MCTFFTMVHCGIFFWCILGFVRWAMHFLGTEYIGRIIRCNVREGSPNSFKDMVSHRCTVYPKKYADGFCFAVLCCGYTLTDFPISIRLTSLALRQSNDCPSASKATLMNMDKYFMWIHYERLHNHNKAKHNKTVRIFLGIYCISKLIKRLTDILRHVGVPDYL